MRVVAVCQARTGSTRLPNKVLLPLAGVPLIIRFLERVKRSHELDAIVVAIPAIASDDQLAQLCMRHGYAVYRGSETDLLDRHVRAARACSADAVVKIPSDCPLIDPDVIDRVVRTYRDAYGEYDYVSNLHPPTWPDGNDVEVMSMDALEFAARTALRSYEREHTTPFLWDANPLVRTHTVSMERGQNYATRYRWTVDYPEDYMLVRAVYDGLHQRMPRFGMYEIMEYLHQHPEVDAINAHLCGVNWYRHHLSDLKTKSIEDTRV